MMRFMPAAERVAVPWKNGGGVTREICVVPEKASMEDFLWRISMATVEIDGPFSRFEGIDRHLSILEGQLVLRVDGHNHFLSAGEAGLAFAGDVTASAEPMDGKVIDLNVMTRRNLFRSRVTPLAPGVDMGFDEAHLAATVIVATEPAIIGEVQLDRFDSLHIQPGATSVCLKQGRIIRIDIMHA